MDPEDRTRKTSARKRLAQRRSGEDDRIQPTPSATDGAPNGIAPILSGGYSASSSKRRWTVLLACLVTVVAFVAFASPLRTPTSNATPTGQAASSESADAGSASSSSTTSAAGNSEAKEEAVDRRALAEILDDSLVNALVARAGQDSKAHWIAAHPDAYSFEGLEVQHKILKLAAEEPEATTYVRNFPFGFPANDQDLSSVDAIDAGASGPDKVPLLFQWDPRWAYTVYCSTTFGLTGCCPTSLAMVYQGVTGKDDMTPYDMGVLAQDGGYMLTFDGTDTAFLTNEAAGLGLSCTVLNADASSLVSALESGMVVIANVGPGDFTTDGHFIVCTGLEDGKVVVNDPYSKVRSSKLWEPVAITDQSYVLFAYTAA